MRARDTSWLGGLLVCLACAGSCTPSPDLELLLDVKTDLVPEDEFRIIRTEVFTTEPVAEARARGRLRNDVRVRRGDPVHQGLRTAELDGLQPGVYYVRVRLLDQSLTPVLQRLAIVTLEKTSVWTIWLTRNCRDVHCDGSQQCLDGRCVDPRCTAETPEHCGPLMCRPDECGADLPADSCAEGRCEDGVCLRVPRDGACEPVEWCKPEDGCQPIESDGTVAAGTSHTCSRGASGTVACWGSNSWGQLGDGTTTQRLLPVEVVGIDDAAGVEAGLHTCARHATGTISCWGHNLHDQLGDGTGTSRSVPVDVMGLDDAVELTSGYGHNCARRASGTVVCWGRWSELPDETTIDPSVPSPVEGLDDAVDLAAGGSHTCALLASGAVACWGRGTSGQLGDGRSTNSAATPVSVVGVEDAVRLAAGGNHACALRASGAVVCWGANSDGYLGDGTTTNRASPVPVSGLADARCLAAGRNHTCACREDGSVTCWGRNTYGQLGDGTTAPSAVPVDVVGLEDVVELTAGTFHTCARDSAGAIACWGDNSTGQLGDGTTTDRSTPIDVVTE